MKKIKRSYFTTPMIYNDTNVFDLCYEKDSMQKDVTSLQKFLLLHGALNFELMQIL